MGDVLDRLRVEGESYREKYGIEVNDSNLEMAVNHVITNLTEGEIALSFYTDRPMRAVLVGREEIPAVTPVLPLKPPVSPKPASPGGWKQFWSGFGFYQKEMSDLEAQEKDYEISRERQEQYRKNQEAMADYARQVEEREQARVRPVEEGSKKEARTRRSFDSLSGQFLPEKGERRREKPCRKNRQEISRDFGEPGERGHLPGSRKK